MVIFLAILPHVTYAQWMCQPVRTCYVTNVSQGGETKTCWDRIECHGYPSGVTYSPINNTFPGGAPTPSGSGGSAARVESEKKYCELNKARIYSENYQCRTSAQTRYSTKARKCTTDSSVSVTLGLINATSERHRICVEQLERELDTDKMTCNAKPEYSTCKAHGIL